MIARWLALGSLLLTLSLSGCAGYRFGAASLHRPDILTIHVPIAESDTYRRHLGEWLTEALVEEIENNTPMKVVTAARADSILRTRIVGQNKRTLIEDRFDVPRDIELATGVYFEWVDRNGRLLARWNVTQSADLIPEGGQSITTAQQETIRKLARQVVQRLEAGW